MILQVGSHFSALDMEAWAQAVPLIAIRTGNTTLDQGLPMFYDCIKEAVDQSNTEQEPNYFHDEPTKLEVNHCYSSIFSVNHANFRSPNEIESSGKYSDHQELSSDNIHKEISTGNHHDSEKFSESQGPESFMVIPG